MLGNPPIEPDFDQDLMSARTALRVLSKAFRQRTVGAATAASASANTGAGVTVGAAGSGVFAAGTPVLESNIF